LFGEAEGVGKIPHGGKPNSFKNHQSNINAADELTNTTANILLSPLYIVQGHDGATFT
jgi:hypothetical protein